MVTKKLLLTKIKREIFLVRDQFDSKFLSLALARIKKLELLLSKEDRWLEIGGFLGGFVILTSKHVEHIHTFEPDKSNYDVLLKNIEYHSLNNVDAYLLAVIGDDDPKRPFYLNRYTDKSLHSLKKSKHRNTGNIIDCININKIIKDYNIDKLLIDAGGSEYDLIKCLDMNSFIRLKEIGVIYYADFYNAKKREHLEYKEIVQILKNHYKYVQHNNNPYGELYLLIHAFENLLI
ncbi:MAG TPA: FkbM family methyltransferase [Chitinophagales bacterium]|nr:FkbM family methyltransferase [Chitinophagales bacterium]